MIVSKQNKVIFTKKYVIFQVNSVSIKLVFFSRKNFAYVNKLNASDYDF